MFHLNSSLPGGSDKWDTNFARLYLRISEDQLEKINKIPGWSKTAIEKTAAENDKTLENIEKQLTQLPSTSIENILTTGVNISEKENGYLKNQNYISNIQSKQNPVASLNDKELFLKNLSLSPLRKNHTTSYSLQRSRSLPDLCKKSLSAENFTISEEIYKTQIQSTEKDPPSFKHVPLLTKNILNKTYVVPGFSDDCVNHNKLLETNHKSIYYTLGNPKEKFKTLDDSILNRKYLKATGAPVTMSDFSKDVITSMKQDMGLIERKLLLLQRRFSPSKETSLPPFNSKLINVENLNLEKNLKSSQSPVPPGVEVATAVVSSDSVEDLPNEMKNSSISISNKALESSANSQPINGKSDALKNTIISAEDASKTAACNFDSFLSPPLPCGQPIPTEVLSHSEPILSQKSVELNCHSKLQNASLPDPCGYLPTEVPSLSQPIISQKSAKLNTPNKSLSAERDGKPKALEKQSGTFSVFSANLNEKVSDLASDKESGTKRKRRSRNEKSLKSDVKKLKRSGIHFSSAQIRSMIEIMKIFHT